MQPQDVQIIISLKKEIGNVHPLAYIKLYVLYSYLRILFQPIIVSAHATHAASQWRHFRWLLESSDRLSLLLWSPEEDRSWRNDSSYYDLLTVR